LAVHFLALGGRITVQLWIWRRAWDHAVVVQLHLVAASRRPWRSMRWAVN